MECLLWNGRYTLGLAGVFFWAVGWDCRFLDGALHTLVHFGNIHSAFLSNDNTKKEHFLHAVIVLSFSFVVRVFDGLRHALLLSIDIETLEGAFVNHFGHV